MEPCIVAGVRCKKCVVCVFHHLSLAKNGFLFLISLRSFSRSVLISSNFFEFTQKNSAA